MILGVQGVVVGVHISEKIKKLGVVAAVQK
jgi:hypothetical protein